MLNNKKGRRMRHPYAGLAVFSLAAAGVISITRKGKKLFKDATHSIGNMIKGAGQQ